MLDKNVAVGIIESGGRSRSIVIWPLLCSGPAACTAFGGVLFCANFSVPAKRAKQVRLNSDHVVVSPVSQDAQQRWNYEGTPKAGSQLAVFGRENTTDTGMERKRIFFSGYVQGVGFRYSTLQIAKNHQVAGWVRNRTDGRVELLVEGVASEIESLVTTLVAKTHGRVDQIERLQESFDGSLAGFEITETR